MNIAAWLWRYKAPRRRDGRWYVRQGPFHEGAPIERHPLYRIDPAEAALLARALVFTADGRDPECFTDEQRETMLEMANLLGARDVPST